MNNEENTQDRQPLSPEEKREFAQKQLNFLTENGFKNPRHRSRIFKAAGPGQVTEAFELYKQADTDERKDILDCLLAGAGGAGQRLMPKDRMEAVLAACGFRPPKATSMRSFYRILDGSMEMLVPNAYEFTEEEEQEIEDGLVRSRKKFEQLATEDAKE
jgi:hypothetical protein